MVSDKSLVEEFIKPQRKILVDLWRHERRLLTKRMCVVIFRKFRLALITLLVCKSFGRKRPIRR